MNELDPPNVVFVAGNARGTCCSCGGYTPSTCLTGVLRVLDGLTGQEIWSLRRAEPGSIGFAGLSVAIADVNRDGYMEIVTVTGEGKIAVVDHLGNVLSVSEEPVEGTSAGSFGWGGGLAVADMDGDGELEMAYGRSLFTIAPAGVTRLFVGSGGRGGSPSWALSLFADADMAMGGDLELIAGNTVCNNTVYKKDGTILWQHSDLPDGLDAVADLDGNGLPDVVMVRNGQVWVLNGVNGNTKLGPATLEGNGNGGPPTVADFDGDGHPEIGVAQADYYSVLKPSWNTSTLDLLWNEHTYHVTNICDPRDSACDANEPYGVVPLREKNNWRQPWLNNFRQNVQDKGLFNAPDATVSLKVDCTNPPLLHAYVRNLGTAILPAGVMVGFYVLKAGGERKLAEDQTATDLFPGQVGEVSNQTLAQDNVTTDSTFLARIEIDPNHVTFHECRNDNNESAPTKADCNIVE